MRPQANITDIRRARPSVLLTFFSLLLRSCPLESWYSKICTALPWCEIINIKGHLAVAGAQFKRQRNNVRAYDKYRPAIWVPQCVRTRLYIYIIQIDFVTTIHRIYILLRKKQWFFPLFFFSSIFFFVGLSSPCMKAGQPFVQGTFLWPVLVVVDVPVIISLSDICFW